MQISSPQEDFPEIGTVANPAFFFDGTDLLVCYETPPISGGGNAVIKFQEVFDFKVSTINVEGLDECRYPIKPWKINEIHSSNDVERWSALNTRFWIISFNDLMLEVIFENVSFVIYDPVRGSQSKTLLSVIRS